MFNQDYDYFEILCKELIGYDLTKPKERILASKSEVYKTVCPKLVKDAAELAESLLNR